MATPPYKRRRRPKKTRRRGRKPKRSFLKTHYRRVFRRRRRRPYRASLRALNRMIYRSYSKPVLVRFYKRYEAEKSLAISTNLLMPVRKRSITLRTGNMASVTSWLVVVSDKHCRRQLFPSPKCPVLKDICGFCNVLLNKWWKF